MHDDKHVRLVNEIRYAERLTQRTARLYRRAATACTFIAILGGSGLASTVAAQVPQWVALGGLALLALSGAFALSVRPLEKAIANEADARKYAALRTQAVSMSTMELDAALQKARETDVAEVELLRDVAFNDTLREIGREDMLSPLSVRQKLLGALA